MSSDPMMYRIRTGRVQAYVYREGNAEVSMFMEFFGRAEYDSTKPILPEFMRLRIQPIVDALNAGSMSETEARKALQRL